MSFEILFYDLFILSYLEKENQDEVITQYEIIQNVDMFSAQKYFELNLENFGPYRINYTKNGRQIEFSVIFSEQL